METLGIHHLGLAVTDLDAAVGRYERLVGARVESTQELPDEGVSAASLVVGDSRVELMEPLSDDTPVGRFLARRGPGMHHVAYAVPDIRAALGALRSGGATLIDDEPRHGLYGDVAFVHFETFDGVLTELVETPSA